MGIDGWAQPPLHGSTGGQALHQVRTVCVFQGLYVEKGRFAPCTNVALVWCGIGIRRGNNIKRNHLIDPKISPSSGKKGGGGVQNPSGTR